MTLSAEALFGTAVLAENVVRHRDNLFSIMDQDLVKYAPLTDAGVTTYHAVETVKELLIPRSSVLVIG